MILIRKLAGWFMTVVTVIGSIGLVGLMLVIGGTVIYRWFGGTFQGSYEVAETFTIVTITLAIVMATIERKHVDVRLIYDHLPRRLQHVLTVGLTFVASVFWVFVAYSALKSTQQLALRGEVTHVLQIDIVPFRWFITAGFFIVAVVLLIYAIKAISASSQNGETSEHES